MRYLLFPGCTVLGRGRNYEMSARAVAKALGIEFIDNDDFECCGFPLKSVDYETYFLIAAFNILSAESQGLNICALCNACLSSLTEVNKKLIEDFDRKARIIALLRRQGFSYRMGENIAVKHFTRIIYEEIGLEEIGKMIRVRLGGIRIAPHYGCHYLRPAEIYNHIEDPENPHSLDELISVTGAQSVEYPEKLKCCGAGVLAIDEELAYSIARPKLQRLTQDSIDAIVLACPFCSVMFDDNQKKMEHKFQEQYNLPVLYYPQILGLALGLEPRILGLQMNRVSTKSLLEKIAKLPH